MKKKRLAIQFFGHLRTFKNTYLSFLENVLKTNKNYEIDIFIHTWDEIEYQEPTWHNTLASEIRGAKLNREDFSFIEEKYKPKKIKVTKQLSVEKEEEFIQFTSDKAKFSNIFNMFYSKYEVNNLRLEYEKENKVKYDFVLYTRGDVFFKNKFYLDEILKIYENELKSFENFENKLFFSGCYRDLAVKEEKLIAASDIFYFAQPEVINKVANFYLELEKDRTTGVLRDNFLSWEYYLLFKIKQKNIKPIQIKYGMNDWFLLRFNDLKKCKKEKKKLFSLRIRKNFIRLILFSSFIKLEWGRNL